MSKRQISITLDSELIELVDQIANITGYSRSEIIGYFIRKAIKDYEEYRKHLTLQKRATYDVIDRVIDQVIRKAFGDQE